MLDVGWQELFIIAVVTIIVVGPREIPTVLRSVMSWVRRIKEMAREFQSGIDDIARESELNEIRREIENTVNVDLDVDLDNDLENAIDTDGEISSEVYDLEKASEELTAQQETLSLRQAELASQQETLTAMRSAAELEESSGYTPPDEATEADIPNAADELTDSANANQSPAPQR